MTSRRGIIGGRRPQELSHNSLVKCRSCSAEIADKAIVCYRCGTPTADHPPVAAPKPTRRISLAAVVTIAAIIVLGAWLIPMTRPGTPERIAAWVVAWIVILSAMTWIRRGRGQRR